MSSLSFRLELVNQSRHAWDKRYQFANSLSTQEQNIEIEKQSKQQLLQRERDFANRMLQQDELRKSVATLDTKMETLANDETGRKLRRLIESQKYAVRSKMTTVDEDVAAIQANRRINEKLLSDIQGDSQRYSLTNMWQNTWHHIKGLWNTELTTVDERSNYDRKSHAWHCLIFGGGFFISRWLSRWLGSFMTQPTESGSKRCCRFPVARLLRIDLVFSVGCVEFRQHPVNGVYLSRWCPGDRCWFWKPKYSWQLHQRLDSACRTSGQSRRPDSDG